MTIMKVKAKNGKVYEYDVPPKSDEQKAEDKERRQRTYTVIHVLKKHKEIFDQCKLIMKQERGGKVSFSEMIYELCLEYIEKRKGKI